MLVCAYIAYWMIALASICIFIQKRLQKVFIVYRSPGLYRRVVYTNDNSVLPYPMTEMYDYTWVLSSNDRGLKSSCVYLQEKEEIIGLIKKENIEGK